MHDRLHTQKRQDGTRVALSLRGERLVACANGHKGVDVDGAKDGDIPCSKDDHIEILLKLSKHRVSLVLGFILLQAHLLCHNLYLLVGIDVDLRVWLKILHVDLLGVVKVSQDMAYRL